jgi:hypothetical protein
MKKPDLVEERVVAAWGGGVASVILLIAIGGCCLIPSMGNSIDDAALLHACAEACGAPGMRSFGRYSSPNCVCNTPDADAP